VRRVRIVTPAAHTPIEIAKEIRMTMIALLTAWAAIGVSTGYEPAADGQLEYIVQIEPQLLDGLVEGNDITSAIPRGLDVRHFRVTIGSGKLPKIAAADPAARNTANRLPTSDGQPLAPPGDEATEVRSGYQPLAGGSGEYVVEITPTGLNDLHSHDLTGDLPAGMPVTRLRVSTQQGSAPAATAPPASAPASDFVSNTSGVGPGLGQSLGAAAAEPSDGSDLVEVPESDRNLLQPADAPLAAGQSGGSQFDPQQASPRLDWPVDPLATPNPQPTGAQPKTQISLPPPPKQTIAGGRDPVGEKNPAFGDRRAPLPGQLAPDPQATALPGKNVTYDESPRTEHQAQKPSTAQRRVTNALESAEEAMNEEVKENPWLSLTLAVALCMSIGANVYLVWIAWDARNRSRMLLDKFHAGEVSLT
jgi:hypothetical protein